MKATMDYLCERNASHAPKMSSNLNFIFEIISACLASILYFKNKYLATSCIIAGIIVIYIT